MQDEANGYDNKYSEFYLEKDDTYDYLFNCEDCGEEFTDEIHKCVHVTGQK